MSTPMPAASGSPVTIEITSNGDGTFTVGMCDSPSADVDDSQQVGDIAQALVMAKHLLLNPPADTDDDSGAGGDPSQGATPDQTGASGSGESAQDLWNSMASENQSAPTN